MEYNSPIGFIVEGHGEYNCYPSLCNKIVEQSGVHTPRVNAGGCGSLVKNIQEHMTDLFTTQSPMNVIITVDLQDILEQNLAESCSDLINIINNEITEWRETAITNPRLNPLPVRVSCIVQVRKFESWLISDINSLIDSQIINSQASIPNGDPEAVNDPVKWLNDNLIVQGKVKQPKFPKQLTTALDPKAMRTSSRSFDKFFRECSSVYQDWLVP